MPAPERLPLSLSLTTWQVSGATRVLLKVITSVTPLKRQISHAVQGTLHGSHHFVAHARSSRHLT